MHLKKMITRMIALISACTLLPVSVPAKAHADDTPQTEDRLMQSLRAEPDSRAFFGAFLAADSIDGIDDSTLRYQEIPLGKLRVSGIAPDVNTDLDYTDMWYSRWEDCRYLFLPATADRSRLTVTLEAAEGQEQAEVSLNGIYIQSGQETALLGTADEFSLNVNGQDCGKLRIMQSNLGAVYLKTAHGNLDYLNLHDTIEETGSVLMLDADGVTQYQGDIGEIERHGNSSWDYSIKKPYNIKLPEKQNLYGMGKAKKWVLISNYLDHSMLRNALTTEICKQTDMPYTSDYVFVDLYADGDYRGTYQLYEKIQIQKQRVNIRDLEEETEALNEKELKEYPRKQVSETGTISYEVDSYRCFDIPNNPEDITGGYLLQFQTYNRYDGRNKVQSGFVTQRGQAVQLSSPKYASEAQVLYMKQFMQELEDAIYSPDGKNSLGRHYSEYLDVESLIRGYLIQEFTINPDGQKTSFFFWKDSDLTGDGKLHYGPAWDFDFAYSNFARKFDDENGLLNAAGRLVSYWTTDPNNFYVLHQPIDSYGEVEDSRIARLGWLGHFIAHEKTRTAEIYLDDFAPVIENYCTKNADGESGISKMADSIAPSAALNIARWHTVGQYLYTPRERMKKFGPYNGETYKECIEYLRNFTEKRQKFLTAEFGKVLIADMQETLRTVHAGYDTARYDAEGIAEMQQILENASDYCETAPDPRNLSGICEIMQQQLDAVPHKEFSGDFDDDLAVTIQDAREVLRHYSRTLIGLPDDISRTAQRNGDVNKDGKLDAVDAMHILRAFVASAVGVSYPLPVSENTLDKSDSM